MSRPRGARGFTILELLIVVAILGILSVVAIIAYKRYVNNARRSEVFSMIAAIKSSEEAYKAEKSAYLATTTTGETDYYPVLGSSGAEPRRKPFNPTAAGKTLWQALSVSAPSPSLFCGYVVVAGDPGSFGSLVGGRGQTLFGNVAPLRPWYYIRAECDFDGNSSTNMTFETTFDSEIVFTDNDGY
jgi:prepilin-type N-terminal cleavage/methylation domain-containing protein